MTRLRRLSFALAIGAATLWTVSYSALRLSGVVVRTNLVSVSAEGLVTSDVAWVQVEGNARSTATRIIAAVYRPLWKLEFRARGVDH